ncbi:MAG: hypothetical protein C0432_04525 [Candidatus Puniceispirillum sp.]|nr:hypothetical protein [Candidatus Pelagibacter sp.]MBA4283541.1 hypothetical protein [Candidatus Puniceispirillum sp.]
MKKLLILIALNTSNIILPNYASETAGAYDEEPDDISKIRNAVYSLADIPAAALKSLNPEKRKAFETQYDDLLDFFEVFQKSMTDFTILKTEILTEHEQKKEWKRKYGPRIRFFNDLLYERIDPEQSDNKAYLCSMMIPPTAISIDPLKANGIEFFFNTDFTKSVQEFYSKIRHSFVTNQQMPNAFRGSAIEENKRNEWLTGNKDYIDFDILKRIFENSTQDNINASNPLENIRIDRTSFRDFSNQNADGTHPVLSPSAVRNNLLGAQDENHWPGAIIRFKQHQQSNVEALNNTWSENLYYIGRTLIEINKKKIACEQQGTWGHTNANGETNLSTCQDLLKDLLIRLASAGGHCENGLNDVKTIYLSAKRKLGFVDNMNQISMRTVDDKIQYLLYLLREDTFKTLVSFENTLETYATSYHYRAAFAEKVRIQPAPSQNQVRYISVGDRPIRVGEMIERHSPARITEGEFLERFFKGREITYLSVSKDLWTNVDREKARSHNGYSPEQIFIRVWNAVNHQTSHIDENIGSHFGSEFLQEYVSLLTPDDYLSNALLQKDEYISRYIKHAMNRLTEEPSKDEINEARNFLKENWNSTNKMAFLKAANSLVSRTDGKSTYWISPEIIIDYLLRKEIIRFWI